MESNEPISLDGHKATNYEECPMCRENSLKYIQQIKSNKCQNYHCKWGDAVGVASDVPISFLEKRLEEVPEGRPKKVIQKTIELTKETYSNSSNLETDNIS